MKKKDNCLKKLTYRIWHMSILEKLNRVHNDTGLPVNDIISDFILNGKIVIDNSKEENNELLRLTIYHLARIGNNLNQLVKSVKLGNLKYVNTERIEKLLAELTLELIELRKEIVKNNDK